ncbi:PspA/IM30 family protein [Bacillus sp. HMF5848]|uniref:PspA/IM30 family protein n=1 Tax=Bacillus sp. HMF5848 TaxID=2495421 RepID=UPI000F7A4B14|nr:PspA/IM30 family protein [Bacillus sp. HMF5848]RSK28252.1 PspA/IM30 family protein [Bacillus sp. HMF5848]
MGLFSKIKTTVEADVQEVLYSNEPKNPIAKLNQYLRESEQEVEKIRKLVARQKALKEEFERELKSTQDMAAKRKYQAEIASRAEETNLHEFALSEQMQYEERAKRIEATLQQTRQHLVDLEKSYEQMKHKLDEMHIKRMELMGRENVARANHRINKVMQTPTNSGFNVSDIEDYFKVIEKNLNTEYYLNSIDAKIAELAKRVNVVEKA